MRLVYLALGWVCGLVLALSADTRLPLAWAVLVVAAAGCVWLLREDRLWLGLSLLALTLGGLRASFVPQTSDIAAFNNRGGLTIEGRVLAEPDARDDVTLLRVDAETVTRAGETTPTDGTVLVRAPVTSLATYGDRVRATGLLVQPGEFDSFSYADFLARRGIYSVLEETAVEIVSSGHGNPIYAWLLRQKEEAAVTIARMVPEPSAGLLAGILLGNERGISPELREDFARTGAAHIIAISGFNMVILAGVVTWALERAGVRGIPAALIALFVLAVYTLLVGANAAVVRAAVMSSVLIFGRALRRGVYVPASLAFVAMLMSLQNPLVLWEISFQLSFFASLGLALFADPLTRRFNELLKRIFPDGTATTLSSVLSEPLVVSIAALIPVLPLTALYFNRISLVQLAVNLLVVPVQTAVLVIGVLAALVAPLSPAIAQVLYWLVMGLLNWTIGVVRVFSALPFAEVTFQVGFTPVLVFFLILIGGAVVHATQPAWAQRTARFVSSSLVFSSVVLVGIVLSALMGVLALSRPDGRMHLWLLDVGHSNAVLVQSPGGAQILMDGGRFPSRLLTQIGDRVPFHDREIDVLVLTQPDPFQTGALTALLARYDVGLVLTNGQPNQSEAAVQLEAALQPHETVIVSAGYTLEMSDGLRLEVLHPQQQPELTDSLDENALVTRLSFGDVSFLLTSDLSQSGQQIMLEEGAWPLATVMQLPQHGAPRSLSGAFLEAVQPQALLLQSDRANRLGHPDPDLLARLPDDVPLLRTDESGILHLWTDGTTLEVAL